MGITNQLLKLYLGKMWIFLKPFITMFLSKAGTALAGAALAAVQAVAISGVTGDKERRDTAFAMIEQDLRNRGIQIGVEVTTSMINAAIEVAVQNMKGGK